MSAKKPKEGQTVIALIERKEEGERSIKQNTVLIAGTRARL